MLSQDSQSKHIMISEGQGSRDATPKGSLQGGASKTNTQVFSDSPINEEKHETDGLSSKDPSVSHQLTSNPNINDEKQPFSAPNEKVDMELKVAPPED